MGISCAVIGCKNRDDQGKFDGNLCAVCHKELEELLEQKVFSQARRNIREEAVNYLRSSEHYKVDLKWK